MERRLAAILAADVVGYSRLMGEDETGTLERLKSLRKELVQPKVTERKGRIVKLMGDGLLAEFPSVAEEDMAIFPGRKLAAWEDYWHGAMEYQDNADFEHLYDALRKAGLED